MGAKSLPSLWANLAPSDARALGLATLWRVESVLPPCASVSEFSAAIRAEVAKSGWILGLAAAELEAVVRVIWRQLRGQRRNLQESVQVPLDLGPL